MNLWRLECFVVLAHELHFRIAAERLHLSQPGLSQQIKHLEQALGVQLIARSPVIALTEAGSLLLPDAEKVLEMVSIMVERVSAADAAVRGELRVGFARSIEVSRSFGIVKSFMEQNPATRVTSQTLWTAIGVRELKQGKIDVAFVRLPIEDEPGIETLRLGSDEQLLAISTSHPLSRRESLTRDDVANIDLIHWDREQAPGNFDAVIESFRGGYLTRLGLSQPDLEHRLAAVAAGDGIALVHAFSALQATQVPHIELKTISPAPPTSDFGIAWGAGSTSYAVRRFVSMVRNMNETSPAG